MRGTCPGTGWTDDARRRRLRHEPARRPEPADVPVHAARSARAARRRPRRTTRSSTSPPSSYVDTTPGTDAPELRVVSASILRNQNQAPVASVRLDAVVGLAHRRAQRRRLDGLRGPHAGLLLVQDARCRRRRSIDCAHPTVTGSTSPRTLWGAAGFIGAGITLTHTFPLTDGASGTTRNIGLVACDPGDRFDVAGIPPKALDPRGDPDMSRRLRTEDGSALVVALVAARDHDHDRARVVRARRTPSRRARASSASARRRSTSPRPCSTARASRSRRSGPATPSAAPRCRRPARRRPSSRGARTRARSRPATPPARRRRTSRASTSPPTRAGRRASATTAARSATRSSTPRSTPRRAARTSRPARPTRCPGPCKWDANGDLMLWVQARAVVRGRPRNVVALLRREQFAEAVAGRQRRDGRQLRDVELRQQDDHQRDGLAGRRALHVDGALVHGLRRGQEPGAAADDRARRRDAAGDDRRAARALHVRRAEREPVDVLHVVSRDARPGAVVYIDVPATTTLHRLQQRDVQLVGQSGDPHHGARHAVAEGLVLRDPVHGQRAERLRPRC